MSIIYVGDLHGEISPLSAIDAWAHEHNIETVIQVGDFGAFWPGQACKIRHYFQKRQSKNRPGPRWIVSPGNHDNWDLFDQKVTTLGLPEQGGGLVEMAPGLFYARRGTVEDIDGRSHLFFGGATSTDKYHRTEGESWWAREQPSSTEFNEFFDRLSGDKPQIVVTHDAPTRVNSWRINRDRDPVVCGLESALSISGHQPNYWFFGHHHYLERWDVEGTTFGCCGIAGDFWHLDDNGMQQGSLANRVPKHQRGLSKAV
jgi:hypothetical protein